MSAPSPGPVPTGRRHLAALAEPLAALQAQTDRIDGWGVHLARVLSAGGRLLVAGNGGSAAQAQHLTSELVGRYRDERRPFSAIALCAESASLTAIVNDYGVHDVFARQVRGHGRAGDVLVVLSTSGTSANVIAAAEAGREVGMTVWGFTGPGPNPLSASCDDAVVVDAPTTATVQEIHQVVVHLLCAAVEVALVASSVTARARRVVVVGDALLDRDVEGTVERICPDAPVPVVEIQRQQTRPGGAALAATLAAGDGADVTLITALSGDAPGLELARLLTDAGVDVVDLGLDGSTPEKVRVRAQGQSLFRLDHGGRPGAVGPVTEEARATLTDAVAVLVADYGRGVAAELGLRQALAEVAVRTPVVWDPHPRGPQPVAGVRLVTPNQGEATAAVAEEIGGQGLAAGTVASMADAARRLARRWDASAVAVTMGARGALLAGVDGPPLVVPALAAVPGDSCGAGDRFAAGVVVALAGGAIMSEAVEEGVRVASAYVAAGGVAAWTAAGPGPAATNVPAAMSVEGRLRPRPTAPAPAPDVVAEVRARGGLVVATGGCFDLLHAGHLHLLQAARNLGDCLVVLLNSDASVRRLKGPDRPLQSQDDRAALLAGLDSVDQVIIFEEDTPIEALEGLRPDLFAKGADYAVADLPEAPTLARWGGEAVVLPYLQGRSTTRLIEEALRRAP